MSLIELRSSDGADISEIADLIAEGFLDDVLPPAGIKTQKGDRTTAGMGDRAVARIIIEFHDLSEDPDLLRRLLEKIEELVGKDADVDVRL